MNETEERLRAALHDLELRQSELAGEWGQVTDAINALKKLLGEPVHAEGTPIAETARATQMSSGNAAGNGKPPNAPHFAPGEFFNMSQRQAVIHLLQKVGRPLKVIEMVTMLKEAGFAFASKDEQNVYAAMYTSLRRAAPEVVKHGKVWGLAAWSARRAQSRPLAQRDTPQATSSKSDEDN